MELIPLGEMDLTYLAIDFVDYGVGGQYFGDMEGTWRGDRVSGRLRLTNVAQKRSDNVNTPTLRGVLETDDGARMFVEMNGLSQIQEGGRVFVASLALRTGHPRYQWVNTLFAVVEGELHGRPRANEIEAHCRVYACQATITQVSTAGGHSMRAIAYAFLLPAGQEHMLRVLARDLKVGGGEFGGLRQRNGVAREAAFLQRNEAVLHLIIYREFDDSSPTPYRSDGGLESWLIDRLSSIPGFDPVAASQSKVELLVRQRSTRPGTLHASVLPLLPDKVARLHEWALELNGIHAAELEDSLRRLEHGLTLFVQHIPGVDLVIMVVEGHEPDAALGRLAISQHPFDHWHVHQISDMTGVNLSTPTSPPNELLWDWEGTVTRAAAT